MFLKHHPWNVHVSGVFCWTYVFRFNPTNKKSAFIELTSFKSFDTEVPSFYFGSMPSFAHKPVLHKRPVLRLSKKSLATAITIALVILYLHASAVHQHSTFNRSRVATLLRGTDFRSEVGLLQNFRAYNKWIPLSMENKSFISKETDNKIL